MNPLKSHPFAIAAYFDKSTVLTFALPKDQLMGLIPEPLQLHTFEDKWAFIAVAMVQTRNLRPKGAPSFLGNSFFLIGYRIFVEYYDKRNKRLRGLYIIKTETDKKKMEILGNFFTHYSFSTTDIEQSAKNNIQIIKSKRSQFEVSIDNSETDAEIPVSSPFTDWKDARKFSGPLPYTFTCDKKNNTILMIRGIRQNWKPRPIKVINYHFNFLDNLNLEGSVLASAFEIKNIPYYWEKGKIEKWK